MKMVAKSKRDTFEVIRATDRRALEIMKERDICSFSYAYALALNESDGRPSPWRVQTTTGQGQHRG